MANMDFTSIVKSDFFRFLYAILLPGSFVSLVISFSAYQLLKITNILLWISLPSEYVLYFLIVISMLICGFVVEIIGVYIESECIDDYIKKESKIDKEEFNISWNTYLMVDREKTRNLILVDYYRSILNKMKFLINLPISLILSYIFIILDYCFFNIDIFNISTLNGIKLFILTGLVIYVVSYLSFRRAKHCATILFEARKDLIYYNIHGYSPLH